MKTSENSRERKNILRKSFGIFLRIVVAVVVLAIFVTTFINLYIIFHVKGRVVSVNSAPADYDCILVLGCSVHSDGTPSKVLQKRLDLAIELYKKNGGKILMSGDHKTDYYNEVYVMKNYAISRGVKSEDIFLDHAGYSTYDSIYRAKYVFDVKKMVIVTQEYHIYRALYIAERFGINAYGVGAKDVQSQVLHNNVREIFARDKDFVTCILKPEAEVSGDKISLSGDGDDTNDK